MRVLVLGHTGMLGRAVAQFLATTPDTEVVTLAARFGDEQFLSAITNQSPDAIINCIGKIPQRNPASPDEYTQLNVELPLLLDTLGIRTIFPTTDCEFSGTIPPGFAYQIDSIRDAEDVYGMSKATASHQLQSSGRHTKIIRTSIIGHEAATTVSLLDWFLAQSGEVRGYTNHYWNGITTLQWAKECYQILTNWDEYPTLVQLGTTTHHSKFDILTLAKDVYQKDIEIIPYETELTVNKCLASTYEVPDLRTQLVALKEFFKK